MHKSAVIVVMQPSKFKIKQIPVIYNESTAVQALECFEIIHSPLNCVLQRADAADRKTEKKKLTEIKGTRRDREAKHGARAQQIQRGRSKMFGAAKQSDLRDCIKGTE